MTKTPQVTKLETSANYGKFDIEPLDPGFGTTLGNTLRRVLLSSLWGAAVTSIQIDGVAHEFTAIPHVKEDVTEVILNLKRLCLKSFTGTPSRCSSTSRARPRCARRTSRLHLTSRSSIPTCTSAR